MGIESITKENFCEVVALAYMSTMAIAIVQQGVDVFGLEVDGEPIAPLWAMLIVTAIVIVIWTGCRLVRNKVP